MTKNACGISQNEVKVYESRDEIPERFKWDLESIFPSDEAFEEALKDAQSIPKKIQNYCGKISTSAKDLFEFLQLNDEISSTLIKIATYSSRKSDQDTSNSHYKAYSMQVDSLFVAIQSSASWFATELISIDDNTMQAFYEQCPQLKLYKTMLDRTFRLKEHVLSADCEMLLASAGEMSIAPGDIFSMANDADLTFDDAIDSNGEAKKVTQGSYIPLMNSTDRVLRESAYNSLYRGYGSLINTLAATLNAQVKQLAFFSRARRYDSSLEKALFANEIPVEVYTNLIETLHKHLDQMYRYIDLRKKMLNVDELRFYDLYAPIVEDLDIHFSYEEACEIILEALEPFGEDYLKVVRRAISERWIDVYETPGKRSGAYSSGGYGVHPYMLLNYQGKLDDVFTLIHEMGHSMHTYLSCENQPVCYSDYVIFVAEVASTVNEALLMQYFLKKCDESLKNGRDEADYRREKAYLLNHFLEQFRGTLYRQTMFAEFELEISEMNARGEALTADSLCAAYRALNEKYFGDNIILDDNIAKEWARIPHFYYNFYVYQYATGFSAAMALSNRILSGQKGAVEDYLEFLSSGCSKDPISLLKGAGVDMSSPKPVEDALEIFADLLDQMEELTSTD